MLSQEQLFGTDLAEDRGETNSRCRVRGYIPRHAKEGLDKSPRNRSRGVAACCSVVRIVEYLVRPLRRGGSFYGSRSQQNI